MSSAATLAWARVMLNQRLDVGRGRWSRTAALLMRLGLEESLVERWASIDPVLSDCSMRAQLLTLSEFGGRDLAGEAAHAYNELSLACHAGSYDLPLTVGELERLAAVVERLGTDRGRS